MSAGGVTSVPRPSYPTGRTPRSPSEADTAATAWQWLTPLPTPPHPSPLTSVRFRGYAHGRYASGSATGTRELRWWLGERPLVWSRAPLTHGVVCVFESRSSRWGRELERVVAPPPPSKPTVCYGVWLRLEAGPPDCLRNPGSPVSDGCAIVHLPYWREVAKRRLAQLVTHSTPVQGAASLPFPFKVAYAA